MKQLVALLLLCSVAIADGPTIVGPKSAKVGQPPWVALSVKDAAPGAVAKWSGAIGPGLVGMEAKDGVAVSTAVPGRYAFRCLLQTPKEGLDDVQVLETVLVVEGDGVVPPDVIPVVDFAARLTAAVQASPDAHVGFAKVANVYVLIADQIKGGLLTSPDQVTKMTTLLNAAASPEWAALDTSIVQPHLKSLTLATAGDYEPLWRQIAAAVKAGLTDIPPPDVVPIPVTSLHVMVIEEMDDRHKLPASQVNIFSSTSLRHWLTENNVQWRMFDDDVDQSQLDAKWKAALARPRASVPWVCASNGAKGFEGPLPKTEAELIAILEKYR